MLYCCSWIHLEGRNRETLLEVLKYLNEAKQTRFSVEVEKVNRGFEDFIPYADLVFVSKVLSSPVVPQSPLYF